MSKSVPKIVNRRTLMAACLATPAAALSMGTASAAPSTEKLPDGHQAGSVVGTAEDGSKIFEVLDEQGQRIGYTLEATKLEELHTAAADLDREASTAQKEIQPRASGATTVAACVAAIGWFAAKTIFPSIRVASLAVRLGKLIGKYGARTVARIFMGARGIAGRTAEQEIKDFALAASGIGGLMACGI